MKCNEIRNLVLAYLDSELDARTSQEIEVHLQTCAECAQLFEREEKFNECIFAKLREGGDTPELWSGIETRLKPEPRAGWLLRHWRAAALGGFAAVFIGVLATLLPHTPALDLADAVQKDHQAFVNGEMRAEFSGEIPGVIAEKLGERLDAKAFTASLDAVGFTAEGARLCHLADVPVAWTLGRYQQRPLSLMVFKRDELDHFPQTKRLLESGEPVVCSRAGRYEFGVRLLNGYVVCMVGEVTQPVLEAMLKTVRIPTG